MDLFIYLLLRIVGISVPFRLFHTAPFQVAKTLAFHGIAENAPFTAKELPFPEMLP